MVRINNYIVTGIVRGRRERLSEVMTRGRALQFVKRLKRQLRISIPKYRYVDNIRVERF